MPASIHPKVVLKLLMLLSFLAACHSTQAAFPVPTPALPSLPAATLQPTDTPTMVPPTAVMLTATPGGRFCSPLAGFLLAQIPGLVSNPFHPPPPGYDDPHAGVDLADLQVGSRVALAGRAVRAAQGGLVVAVIKNRFPFGNAVIIETPLDQLGPGWAARLDLPTPAPAQPPHSALTCPTAAAPPVWNAAARSLYLLYAHLQEVPALQPGETVYCGQVLGAIGESGNALNPHLHLEARLGPAGARFTSLAHYDNSATAEEMRGYCAWTVSGAFQLLDPLQVIGAP